MKINKCGCGGECESEEYNKFFRVICKECLNRTSYFKNKGYTINVWNKANPETVREIVEMLEKEYNAHDDEWQWGLALALAIITDGKVCGYALEDRQSKQKYEV